MRAGRNRIARTNANMASNERATARNGKERSHISGQRMMARMAIGQHSTNKTHHKSKVFIGISPQFLGITLSHPQCCELAGGAGLGGGRRRSICLSGFANEVNPNIDALIEHQSRIRLTSLFFNSLLGFGRTAALRFAIIACRSNCLRST